MYLDRNHPQPSTAEYILYILGEIYQFVFARGADLPSARRGIASIKEERRERSSFLFCRFHSACRFCYLPVRQCPKPLVVCCGGPFVSIFMEGPTGKERTILPEIALFRGLLTGGDSSLLRHCCLSSVTSRLEMPAFSCSVTRFPQKTAAKNTPFYQKTQIFHIHPHLPQLSRIGGQLCHATAQPQVRKLRQRCYVPVANVLYFLDIAITDCIYFLE